MLDYCLKSSSRISATCIFRTEKVQQYIKSWDKKDLSEIVESMVYYVQTCHVSIVTISIHY
jgi:hypothetical protein